MEEEIKRADALNAAIKEVAELRCAKEADMWFDVFLKAREFFETLSKNEETLKKTVEVTKNFVKLTGGTPFCGGEDSDFDMSSGSVSGFSTRSSLTEKCRPVVLGEVGGFVLNARVDSTVKYAFRFYFEYGGGVVNPFYEFESTDLTAVERLHIGEGRFPAIFSSELKKRIAESVFGGGAFNEEQKKEICEYLEQRIMGDYAAVAEFGESNGNGDRFAEKALFAMEHDGFDSPLVFNPSISLFVGKAAVAAQAVKLMLALKDTILFEHPKIFANSLATLSGNLAAACSSALSAMEKSLEILKSEI